MADSGVEVRPGVQDGDLVVGVWPEGQPGRFSVIPREWKDKLLSALLRERNLEAIPVEWAKEYRNAYTLQELRAGRGESVPLQREEPE